jgi:hypothetical protein
MIMYLWQRLTITFPWLNAHHPIVQRDVQYVPPLPMFFRRLTEVRSILGYAALIHLTLFVTAMLVYSRSNAQINIFLSPFLTPFGLPLAVAILHSLLYWAFLLGVGNLTTRFIASESSSRSLTVLRLTPYSTAEIVLAKLGAVFHVWKVILITLVVTRLLAAVSVPISLAVESYPHSPYAYALAALFIVQPLVDGTLAASLSALSAALVPSIFWARMLAHALMGVVFGALGGVGALWLVFTSPMGPMAAILAPLSHWSLLSAALVPMRRTEGFLPQFVVLTLVAIVLPLLIAGVVLRTAVWLTKRQV